MDIQTVTVVIAGISVVIGVINSIRSNRRADEQRQVDYVEYLYHELMNRQRRTTRPEVS